MRKGRIKSPCVSLECAIRYIMEQYIVSETLVAGYIEHLTDIEMRKDKQPTDNDRKHAERKQPEYNDIDWQDLYH